MAERLQKMAEKYDCSDARIEASLLRSCAAPWNRWIAEDVENQQGALFDAQGGRSHCQSQFCWGCQPYLLRKNKARLKAGTDYLRFNKAQIKAEFLEKHYPKGTDESFDIRFRMLTLTFTTLPNCSLKEVQRIALYAFDLLNKRRYWKRIIIGGSRTLEWTLGKQHEREQREWNFLTDGYHVHFHCLIYCLKPDPDTIRSLWTDCVMKACQKFRVPIAITTESGYLRIHLTDIHPNRESCRRKGITSLEGAIDEICKYVTKPGVWWELPDDQLSEIVKVKRWPRRFELLGVMRNIDNAQGKSTSDVEPSIRILDSQSLSYAPDKSPKPSKRRRGRNATPTKSLRQLAQEMPFEEWEKLKDWRTGKIQAFRLEQLAHRYPEAVIQLLDGEIFSFSDTRDQQYQLN
jgi:hypothetical protein